MSNSYFGREERGYHVFEKVPQFRHVSSVVVPHSSQRTQQQLSFLALLHRVVAAAAGESRYDLLLGEPFDVLCHKLTNALVQHGTTLIENHVIRIAVIFFEGEFGCIVVMDLAYILR